ncbi:MAG: SH3 domain-containing protein [Omnitrophica WOR_2 bacterium]
MHRKLTIARLWLVFIFVLFFYMVIGAQAARQAQTVESTTTGTAASGLMITVNSGDQDEINVRSGPGTDYTFVGKLLAGQQVPALGRSAGGDWVKIVFPEGPGGAGWVYAYLVTVNGILPVAEPPATPTPQITPTIDKTLAAQFIIEIPATRLPTFTPPPPLAIPTYASVEPVQASGGSQMVYVMIALTAIGILGILLSIIRIR